MNRQNSGIDGSISPVKNIAGSVLASRGGGIKEIYSDTTANWNAKVGLIAKKDCVYVYTDYTMDGDTPIPSMKVGTGNAYLIDLPFVYSGDVTAEQIAFWNNKVTAYIDHDDEELLVLSKD